ncbi:MAG: hypothetical protein H7318_04915 [Oligoflexus sp.]|nr:hypothetical protein [Oligoflexus sp.]
MRSRIILTFLISFSCGKNNATKSGTSIVDFTKNDTIEFKAGSSLGVSATRYDLTLASKALKKYNYSSTDGKYVLEKELTMTEAAKSSLSTKLKKIAVKSHGACAAATCTSGRASVWMEITYVRPARYYFSNQGDCSCPNDGENAPTLVYTQMDEIYKEILVLIGT